MTDKIRGGAPLNAQSWIPPPAGSMDKRAYICPNLLLRKIGTLRFLVYTLNCKFLDCTGIFVTPACVSVAPYLRTSANYSSSSSFCPVLNLCIETFTPFFILFLYAALCSSDFLYKIFHCIFFCETYCTKCITNEHCFSNWMNSTTAMKTSQVHFFNNRWYKASGRLCIDE